MNTRATRTCKSMPKSLLLGARTVSSRKAANSKRGKICDDGDRTVVVTACSPICKTMCAGEGENLLHFHVCDQVGCKYKSKTKMNVRRHQQYVHNIGVVWYPCSVRNCTYKSKAKADLKKHEREKHEIGATWHSCKFEHCTHMTKRKHHLKRHYQLRHKDEKDIKYPPAVEAGENEMLVSFFEDFLKDEDDVCNLSSK